MRAPVRTLVLLAGWSTLLVGPWLLYAARDWELDTDCDLVVRAPETFGYWTAVAALVSLPFAVSAAVRERRWWRALCLAASAISVGILVAGVLISMGLQGTQVDCGGPPWPEST
jgi:hypothetical protein